MIREVLLLFFSLLLFIYGGIKIYSDVNGMNFNFESSYIFIGRVNFTSFNFLFTDFSNIESESTYQTNIYPAYSESYFPWRIKKVSIMNYYY